MTDWKFKAGDVLEHKTAGNKCVVIACEDKYYVVSFGGEADIRFGDVLKSKELIEVAYKLVEEEFLAWLYKGKQPVAYVDASLGNYFAFDPDYSWKKLKHDEEGLEEIPVKACNEPKYD